MTKFVTWTCVSEVTNVLSKPKCVCPIWVFKPNILFCGSEYHLAKLEIAASTSTSTSLAL